MAGGWDDRESDAVLGDLGDGLVLRRAEPEDAEAIAAFNARVHHSSGGPFEQRELHTGIVAMTRDLMSGGHPACVPEDFTMVEDASTGTVISSACLIEQRFTYGGVELRAGLPELVGTHPDYRRRGLVREQMAVLHAWSRERGHPMQAIGGIPNYYRRFGYEMAIWMGSGRRLPRFHFPPTTLRSPLPGRIEPHLPRLLARQGRHTNPAQSPLPPMPLQPRTRLLRCNHIIRTEKASSRRTFVLR